MSTKKIPSKDLGEILKNSPIFDPSKNKLAEINPIFWIKNKKNMEPDSTISIENNIPAIRSVTLFYLVYVAYNVESREKR